MTIRVIQWATGPVGAAQLREVIDRPDLDLVGVLSYHPDKIGVDAGTLVGRPATGVRVTADRAAVIGLDADVVLHAASKAGPDNTNTEDISALLASGKTVITTTSYNHLPTFGAAADRAITDACERGGSRFHAAGEHPGFMFERLAATLTGLCQRVDCVTVREYVDCTGVSERRMLVDLMGMGRDPSEISVESPMFQAVSVQYEQSLAATADVLGLRFDGVTRGIATAVGEQDVAVACGVLPAGTVTAQTLTWTAHRDGVPVLVAEEHWTCGPTGATGSDGGFLLRIDVAGVPPLRVDLTIGNDGVDGLPNTSGGQLAVAMTAVRAIPYVLAAPPGVVIPAVFGAYRFPA
jgi:2,4-diaminopentanoate dehydrogenase